MTKITMTDRIRNLFRGRLGKIFQKKIRCAGTTPYLEYEDAPVLLLSP